MKRIESKKDKVPSWYWLHLDKFIDKESTFNNSSYKVIIFQYNNKLIYLHFYIGKYLNWNLQIRTKLNLSIYHIKVSL